MENGASVSFIIELLVYCDMVLLDYCKEYLAN